MSTRRRIIAGNWKMNTSPEQARILAEGCASTDVSNVDVIVIPPS